MSIQNQSNCQNAPRTVEDIIRAIEEKTADGTYIFRGESQCHDKVASGLYRELKAVKAKYSDIANVQSGIAEAARVYTGEKDEFEILTALQHYGGKTNLIDFTTNYKVALFFACYGLPDKHGRLIILQKTDKLKKILKYPSGLVKRAIDQESVFLQPSDGFIEPDDEDIVNIPKNLKLLILEHLREPTGRGISPQTIYNDIHGFIRSQSYYWMAYREFYEGLTWKDDSDKAKVPEEKQKAYQKAVVHYTRALELDLQQPAIYNNRGNMYVAIGEIDKAVNDLSKAIELKPDYANAYNNRGEAYRSKGEVGEAINDYSKAIEVKSDFAEAYNNRGVAYRDIDDLPRAFDDYNMAIRLNPEFAEAYNNLGNVYDRKGNFDKAIVNFNIAIRLKLGFVDAYVNRGVTYGKTNEFNKAINDFATAINLDPYHAGAYFNRGNAYFLIGDFEKAIENYDTSIKLSPDDAQSYCHRGLAQLHLKEWDKAKIDLTVARNMEFNIIVVFQDFYKNVENCEQLIGAKLPSDIASLLTQP